MLLVLVSSSRRQAFLLWFCCCCTNQPCGGGVAPVLAGVVLVVRVCVCVCTCIVASFRDKHGARTTIVLGRFAFDRILSALPRCYRNGQFDRFGAGVNVDVDVDIHGPRGGWNVFFLGILLGERCHFLDGCLDDHDVIGQAFGGGLQPGVIDIDTSIDMGAPGVVAIDACFADGTSGIAIATHGAFHRRFVFDAGRHHRPTGATTAGGTILGGAGFFRATSSSSGARVRARVRVVHGTTVCDKRERTNPRKQRVVVVAVASGVAFPPPGELFDTRRRRLLGCGRRRRRRQRQRRQRCG
mmetsp:Transcript_23479/g.48045  ORF Transcript_23479/g.48045 Transcript_23479/m.48045 type:complete len:298 (-) Transcript_23479:329-1222(-)